VTPAVPSAGGPEMHRCPLCGTRFAKGAVRCGSCPMSRVCDLACCPNCGYEFVERSAVVDFIKRVTRRLAALFDSGRGREDA